MAEEIFIDTDDLQRRMDGAISSMKGQSLRLLELGELLQVCLIP